MSNTILNQDLGDNNKILPLSFYWIAELKDGSFIKQFDNTEHRFQEVLDKHAELVWFYLFNKENNKKFIIDVINGFIYQDKIIEDFSEKKSINEKQNIRLIYFRTIRNKIGIYDKKLKKQEIHYTIGFQWNDKNGNNEKVLLEIDEIGNIIIGV